MLGYATAGTQAVRWLSQRSLRALNRGCAVGMWLLAAHARDLAPSRRLIAASPPVSSGRKRGERLDDFRRRLHQFDQHAFARDRKFVVALRVQEADVEAGRARRMPPGAKRTPCAVSHSTALGRSSIHSPT